MKRYIYGNLGRDFIFDEHEDRIRKREVKHIRFRLEFLPFLQDDFQRWIVRGLNIVLEHDGIFGGFLEGFSRLLV